MRNEQQASKKNRKNIWLVPVCILAAVALIAGLAFAASAERKAVVQKTLSAFYNALYIESDLDAMTQCLAEEAREDFQTVMSMGGISPAFFRNYAQEAILKVGEGFTTAVRLTELSEYGVSEVAMIRQTFPNADKAARAKYEIVFTASDGTESIYTNEMILVLVNNHWYMTTYLTLPIGANMAIGNE